MSRHQRKRPNYGEEPEQVDDLAHAASFAQVPAYQFKPAVVKEEAKEPATNDRLAANESESESDSDDSDGDAAEDDKPEEESKGIEKEEEEDSDDESDVDLSEALAKMEDESEGPKQKTQNRAPTTEHEVDPYKTPIDELQSNFQLSLTVEEEEHLRLAGSVDPAANAGSAVQLCPAGHVSCHMVEDRTIVVESSPTLKKGPLDEGSLLVVRVESLDEKQKMRLLPLGKVFEVFGPISRPLYTIRLPPPPSHPKKKKEVQEKKDSQKKQTEKKESGADENEISISDDEGDEKVESVPVKEEPIVEKDPVEKTEIVDKPLPPDDWAPTGQFTAIVAASARQTVFYIEDEAKLLDTFAIMRTSGKGCDASNLYDEEVLASNDMYFSDDEQEREFKSRGKKKKKNQRRDAGNQNHGQQHTNIPGFHAPPQQSAQRLPGFHPPAQNRPPPPPPPPPPRQQYMQQTGGHPGAAQYPYPQGNMPPQQNMQYQQYQQQPGYPPQPYATNGQHQQQYPYPQGGQQYPPAAYPYAQPYPQQFQQQQPYQQQPYPPNANQTNAPPDDNDTVYFN